MTNRLIFLLPIIFLTLLINLSCANGPVRGETTGDNSLPPKTLSSDLVGLPVDATVKIYFENTLSMDGYINGNTDFKDVFRELLVAVENEDKIDFLTEFYLINDKLIKENFKVETTKIADALTKKSISKGSRGTSNFEDVLNTVLENQEGDVISIVMADFIYSPGKDTNTPSALNKLKTYTKEAFLKAGITNKNLETRIYSFTSSFNGIYYDINDKHITGITQRPYYYFVIAPVGLMELFDKQIAPQLKKNKSFNNEMVISSKNYSNIDYRVLTATSNNGRLNPRNGIEITSYPRQGKLEFAVALNLKDLPVNNNYILNGKNYRLNQNIKVKDLGLVNGKNIDFQKGGKVPLHASDLKNLQGKGLTHVILLRAEGLVSEDIQISLKKTIPNWVAETNSDDDRDIKNDPLEQEKTFGFSSLIQGIAEAYKQRTGSQEYFDLKIPVTN